MKLVFISDKVCWPEKTSPTGFSTVGGFPFQMEAISHLFDQTRLVIMERRPPVPPNLMPLAGHNLSVHPVEEPAGEGWRHLLSILAWLPSGLGTYWQEVKNADALHIAVPGLGIIAILVGLLQRRRMFIRHCGTWDQPVTFANHVLLWLLERIASEQNIVFATGGAETPPSARNPHIRWIFSTSLSQRELDEIPPAPAWDGRSPLRLVTVGRLTSDKNMLAIIEALPEIRTVHPRATLEIAGDGDFLPELTARVNALGLEEAVTFHGNVNHAQVLEILGRSHLFVFPTRLKEGFPKAMLEALACGLPVIATRISVIPQLLHNGAGLLLEDTSAPAVARAILQMAADPQQMAAMAALARQAARGYTLEAWGEAIGTTLRAAWGPLNSGDGL